MHGKGERNMEPALSRYVKVATGVGDERTEDARGGAALDRRWISIERVEVRYADQRVTCGIENAQDVVDGLHHKAIPGTQSLVRWLNGELVPPIGKALLAVV